MKLRYSDITPEPIYVNRRAFMVGIGALALGACASDTQAAPPPEPGPLKATPNPTYKHADAPTKYESATTYNNFYEFGTDKGDPVAHAGRLRSEERRVGRV